MAPETKRQMLRKTWKNQPAEARFLEPSLTRFSSRLRDFYRQNLLDARALLEADPAALGAPDRGSELPSLDLAGASSPRKGKQAADPEAPLPEEDPLAGLLEMDVPDLGMEMGGPGLDSFAFETGPLGMSTMSAGGGYGLSTTGSFMLGGGDGPLDAEAAAAEAAEVEAESGRSNWSARTIRVLRHLGEHMDVSVDDDDDNDDANDANDVADPAVLEAKAVSFEKTFAPPNRHTAAAAFFELLVLEAHGRVKMTQTSPYDDLAIAPTAEFSAPLPGVGAH